MKRSHAVALPPRRKLATPRQNMIMAKRRQIAYGKYSQRHPGGEIKGYDITNMTVPTTASVIPWLFNQTGSLTSLSLITLGSSAWNRTGRKVALKSCRIRGAFIPTGNAGQNATPQYCRMILIYDKQPNGALPALADVLANQYSLAADTTASTGFAGINLNNRERFEVIRDWEVLLPPCQTSTNPATANNPAFTATTDEMHVNMFAKLNNREVHYKADSSPAVITDVATGNLFLLTVGNLVAGAEPWELNASIRIRYSDL